MTEDFINELESSEIVAKVGIGSIKIGMSQSELELLYTADEIEDRNIYVVYKTDFVLVYVLKKSRKVDSVGVKSTVCDFH